jgi:hypothetical protein
VAYKILYPDAKHRELDIEARAVESDATLLNPRQDRFEAIDRADWESCDALVVSRSAPHGAPLARRVRFRENVRRGIRILNSSLKGSGERRSTFGNI